MIEQTLNDLNLTLRELAAAVQALVALQQSAAPGAPVASATASAPSFSAVPPATVEAPAPAGVSVPAGTAEAPAPAGVSVPAGTAAAPAPAPVTQPAPPITPEALRALCIRAGQAGHTAYVVDFLRTRGVSMLSELPAKYHAELAAALSAMGVQ